MLRAFFLSLFLIFGTEASPRPAMPPFTSQVIDRVSRAEHVIYIRNAMDGGRCTATAVGPHTLLTAAHCYVVSPLIRVDDDVRQLISFQSDNNDHLLIQVNGSAFTDLLPINQRDISPDEAVVVVGNPGHSRSVLRFGTFDTVETDEGEDGQSRDFYWFHMFGAPGDSGAAMVDGAGSVIGVVTGGRVGDAETFTFALAFTPAQLAGIK